jgi:hypothetical protein
MRTALAVTSIVLVGCGADRAFHEAQHPALPQVHNGGGKLLSAAQLVAVSFDGDPLRADIESFVSRIGGSHYWNATTSEYGIGSASAQAPLHIADAPPVVTDSALQTMLSEQLATPGVPTPSDQSVYVVFLPTTTGLEHADGTPRCGGYHSSMIAPSGQRIAYAVVARCIESDQVTRDEVTTLASHELIEAVTDPFDDGYHAPPPSSDWAWTFAMNGGEVGDLCEHDAASVYGDAELGFVVQRTWSNAAARAGHDPCVPHANGDVYFGAAPVTGDALTLTSKLPGNPSLATTGVHIPIEGRKTIPIALFGEAASGPIDVWAEEIPIDAATQEPADLEFSLDRATGGNGDILQLTIDVIGDRFGDGHEFAMVYAQSGDQQHRWPFIIGN